MVGEYLPLEARCGSVAFSIGWGIIHHQHNLTVSTLDSGSVTINMNNVKQKSELRIKLEAILIMASVFLGVFIAETFGFYGTILFLLVWGASIVVYYVAVRPIVVSRLPHQNIGETPKSFLKKCVKCGREISIASEQCPFCESKQP